MSSAPRTSFHFARLVRPEVRAPLRRDVPGRDWRASKDETRQGRWNRVPQRLDLALSCEDAWSPSRVHVRRLADALVSVIGVTWGFDSEELLVAAKPELLAKEPAEIVRWVVADEAAGHVSGHRRS